MHDASCRYHARLSGMEKNLATMPALWSDVSALKAGDTAKKWQGDATQKLDEISKNLLLLFH
jgi:hypothetical protein